MKFNAVKIQIGFRNQINKELLQLCNYDRNYVRDFFPVGS